MLSEQVLEELARNAPLQKLMVETAWPSLGVESKLQLIHAVQGSGSGGTATWVMELCADDPAPIVRYWAARRYSYPDSAELLRAKSTSDSNELVRACAAEDPWEAGATVNRLVFARNKGTAHLVSGLSKAFDAGMSDADLSNSLREVLQKPEVQEDLKFKGMYADGATAHYEGDVVKDGWALARKAGPRTQSLLASALPTDRGLARIAPADLATMPVEVLTSLAYRRDKTREIAEALQLVLSAPEKYEASVIGSIQDGLRYCADYEDGDSKGNSSIDRGQETLDQILTLKTQVQGLAEQLDTLQQLASAKKGWLS